MLTQTTDARTQGLIAAYEQLSRAHLTALLDLYAEDASFKDPFNEVRGRVAIERIFTHMFDVLVAPRFVVTQAVSEGSQAFLSWEFHFCRSAGSRPMCIHGATHLHFGPDGRVSAHRDYWDAAEELYAKLPVLGPFMRWIQRQLATPQHG